jgi:GNAT superfamily N-acetyltransferase
MHPTFHLRRAQTSDYPTIVALINAVDRKPITLAEFQHWDDIVSPERIYRRTVAEDSGGAVAGYAVVNHHAWQPAGHFYLWVTTSSAGRGQGIGAALYGDARAFIRGQAAVTLTSEIRDDDEGALGFAAHRGWAIDRHHFESVLDLTTFDERRFLAEAAALAGQGLRIFSLADAGNTQEARRGLYAVNRACALDVPGSDGTFMSFEEFERWVCQADWFRPAGQLIAALGDEWVGLAPVQLLPEDRGAYNLMTGVLAPYRGRKIGLALKLAAIRYARDCGARYLRTNNDSLNVPMLAINHKVGYQPEPGKYILRAQPD